MPSQTDRQRRRGGRRALFAGVKLELPSQNGSATVSPAKLVDVSDYGCGLETGFALSVGGLCAVKNLPPTVVENGQGVVKARVVHCRLHDEGVYRSGLAFEETGKQKSTGKQEPVANSDLTDYYEALQISPNADAETIQRVYRMLAQRFHPDNSDTGNEARFRLVLQAYRVLIDPEKRAEYDARHRAAASVRWKIFDKPEDGVGIEEEKRKRWGILSALYMKRKREPTKPGLRLREMENLLGCPREHLEFSMWYLRGKSYIVVEDNGYFHITPEGAEVLENAGIENLPKMPKLIEAAHKPNGKPGKQVADSQSV